MPTNWSDRPLSGKAEDQLERAGYSIHAAHQIVSSHTWDDSVVFGLMGPWGSGKSSVLAMIAEEIEASAPGWQVVRFSPWATGDTAGLLGDFYAALISALPKRHRRGFRRSMGTLMQAAAPAISFVPYGGAIATLAGSAGRAISARKPWDAEFNKAAAQLRKLNTPILVIADDIDRLQADELLTLLKVVRLLGRFPGVVYLLAYDPATLYRTLSNADVVADGDDSAARFMEKIVQHPLVVPPLLPSQLLARLDAGLEAVLATCKRAQLDSVRLGRLKDVYLSQLATPRAIDRYLADLEHHLPLVSQEEINDEDVIILALVRAAFPALYVQLPQWRDQLISGHTDEMHVVNGRIERERFDLEPLLSDLPQRSRADGRALLEALFPRLAEERISYSPVPEGRRICDSRYFDRYFAMNIPSSDVSDVEVADAVAAAINGDGAALSRLITRADFERTTLAIGKAAHICGKLPVGPDGDVARLAVLTVLVRVLDQVPRNHRSFSDPWVQALSWAGDLANHLSETATKEELSRALDVGDLLARVQVVRYAIRDSTPMPSCVAAVVADLNTPLTQAVLEHLRQRDSAPKEDGVGWMIDFLINVGDPQGLRAGIAASLNNHDFAIDDVAARLVDRGMLMGVTPRYELMSFDQESFNRLAPMRPDPWYASPVVDVDKFDMSWANRRAFAAGRAKQPPDQQKPQENRVRPELE